MNKIIYVVFVVLYVETKLKLKKHRKIKLRFLKAKSGCEFSFDFNLGSAANSKKYSPCTNRPLYATLKIVNESFGVIIM